MRAFFATILLVVLGGCSTIVENYITQKAPPEVASDELCNIKRYHLDLALPADITRALKDETSFRKFVSKDLSRRQGDMLFLSGGSQNGAFGAGFLAGWKKRDGNLPGFRMVTGVSTGALQSTFAFIDRPEIAEEGYSIREENDILRTYVDGRDVSDTISLKAILTILGEGAIADLTPLGEWLHGKLTPEIFQAISERYRDTNNGGRLFVGVTDLDANIAIAFDMSELGDRIATEEDSTRKARLKDCYVDALLASSIVPPAAKPVFIDNRMYIDGGAKFTVFAEDIGAELSRRERAPARNRSEGDRAYLIYNNTAEFSSVCGKRDSDACGKPPYLGLEGAHLDWSAIYLAERTVPILIEQIERFSINRVVTVQKSRPGEFFFIRIQPEKLAQHTTDLDGRWEGGELTCDQWRNLDIEADDPVEFFPRYMNCLTNFGHESGMSSWENPMRESGQSQ